jgi:F0F1-type ATP synthase membrane subunit c/vacuolar-type H+-ATPase subunit K
MTEGNYTTVNMATQEADQMKRSIVVDVIVETIFIIGMFVGYTREPP